MKEYKSTKNTKNTQYSRLACVSSAWSLVYLTRRRKKHQQSRLLECYRDGWVPYVNTVTASYQIPITRVLPWWLVTAREIP